MSEWKTDEQRDKLCRAIAAMIARRLPQGRVEFDELLGPAWEGWQRAAAEFDPSRGVKFETFAYRFIRGAILDYLRLIDPATRRNRKAMKRVELTFLRLSSELGRRPSPAELEARLDSAATVPMTKAVADQEVFSFLKHPGNKSRREAFFVELTRGLTFEQQVMLYLKFIRNAKATDIAEVFGLSDSRVHQIISKAIESVRQTRTSGESWENWRAAA